jgi:superfamily I DNA/RNA helicase
MKVFGYPGSGKTTLGKRIVLDFIEKKLIRPDEILYSSFTRSACAEIVERVTSGTNYEPDDFPYFRTLHSLCYRLLKLNKDNVVTLRHLMEIGNKLNIKFSACLRRINDEDQFFWEMTEEEGDKILSLYNLERNLMCDVDPFVYSIDPVMYKLFKRDYEEYKKKNNLFDFCDMIKQVLEQGLYPDGIKLAIFDEHQDTSRLQNQLIKMWIDMVKPEMVMFLGDPFQAIYAFQGAHPNNFLNIQSHSDVVLGHSFRIPKCLTQVLNYFYHMMGGKHTIDTENKEQGNIKIIDEFEIPEVIKKLEGNTFILSRHRYTCDRIADLLLNERLPFRNHRGKDYTPARMLLDGIRCIQRNQFNVMILKDVLEYIKHADLQRYTVRGTKAKVMRMQDDQKVTKAELLQLGFTSEFMTDLDNDRILDVVFKDDKLKNYVLACEKNNNVKVHVGTCHWAKGREADNVFVIPELTRRCYESYLQDEQGENRVFYVAVSRSRRNLFIVRPSCARFTYPLEDYVNA